MSLGARIVAIATMAVVWGLAFGWGHALNFAIGVVIALVILLFGRRREA